MPSYFAAFFSYTISLVSLGEAILSFSISMVWSFKNGAVLSGLKSYYPSAKDECKGVEFATKVNDVKNVL